MAMKKVILKVFLSLLVLVLTVSALTMTASADPVPFEFWMIGDYSLRWDFSDELVRLYVITCNGIQFTTNSGILSIEDLEAKMRETNAPSGNYTIRVSARDWTGSEIAAGTYEYAYVPRLAPPTNLRLNGFTAEWDPVPGATKYEVCLYVREAMEDSYFGNTNLRQLKRVCQVTAASAEFDWYYFDDINDYSFSVVAKGAGIPDSRERFSNDQKITSTQYTFHPITAEISYGTMSWLCAYKGNYRLDCYAQRDGTPVFSKTIRRASATKVLDIYLWEDLTAGGVEAGKYIITLSALNSSGDIISRWENESVHIRKPQKPNSPVRDLTATAGDHRVTLSWTMPENQTGASLTCNVYIDGQFYANSYSSTGMVIKDLDLREYSFYVRPVNSEGEYPGTLSGIVKARPIEKKLATPANLRFEGLEMKWDPVPNAINYKIVLYRDTGTGFFPVGQYTRTASTLSNQLKIDKTTLKTNSVYYFTVTASNPEYTSSEVATSLQKEITTNEFPSYPIVIRADGDMVTWSESADPDFDHVKIIIEGYSSDNIDISTRSVDLYAFLLSKNAPARSVSFSVYAYDRYNNCLSEDWIHYRYHMPSELGNLSAVSVNGRLCLSWTVSLASHDSITGYSYKIGEAGEWISTGSTEPSLAIAGLTEGTSYKIYVRGESEYGISAAKSITATYSPTVFWAAGFNMEPGTYLEQGAAAATTVKPDDHYLHYSADGKTVTLHNFAYCGEGLADSDGRRSIIYLKNGYLTVKIEGTNTLAGIAGREIDGITVKNGRLTLMGDGISASKLIFADSLGGAMRSYGDLHMQDCWISAAFQAYGAYSDTEYIVAARTKFVYTGYYGFCGRYSTEFDYESTLTLNCTKKAALGTLSDYYRIRFKNEPGTSGAVYGFSGWNILCGSSAASAVPPENEYSCSRSKYVRAIPLTHTHTFGAWEKHNAAQHKRTCLICDEVLYEDHSFDAAGICTECGYNRLRFKSAALVMYNNMSMFYNVGKDMLTEGGYTDPYVVFTFNGTETTVTDCTDSGDVLVFEFKNILSYQLNDNIAAVLYAYDANGVLRSSEVQNYSVATYCYNRIEKSTDSAMRTLAVDILNYGTAAQIYFDYQTDNLINAKLTEAQRALASADRTLTSVTNRDHVVVPNAAVTWKSATLSFENAIAIRYKLETSSIDGLVLKLRDSAGREWNMQASELVKESDGVYYAYFRGLSATEFTNIVDATFYREGRAVSNTLRYSIESYAYSKQDSETPGLADLVKSMMRYGFSAKEYIINK